MVSVVRHNHRVLTIRLGLARSLEQCDHCNSTGCSCGSVVVISSSEATVPLYEHGSKYGWGAMLPGKYYEATHCYAG